MSIFTHRKQSKYWQSIFRSITFVSLLPIAGVGAEPTPSTATSDLFELDEYVELFDLLDAKAGAIETNLLTDILPQNVVQDESILLPAKVLPNNRVQPNTTRWIFNGTSVNHLTTRSLFVGGESSSNSTPFQSVNGLINFGGQTTEKTDRSGVYTLDYRGTFGQIQTLRTSHQVITDLVQPSVMVGFRERLTLTGDCILPGTPVGSQCSYLPGLVSDRSSLNENQLATRIDQTSPFGAVLTPASLAAIRQPGFQSGANGQVVGADLYFPNAGLQAGNSQSLETIVGRKETFGQTPAIALGRIHQTVVVNDREAAIGRTIRGNAYIQGDRNLLTFAGLQLATEGLPEAIPALAPATSDRAPSINRNLFRAPDLARIPENSFTLYQAGIARAPHSANKVAKLTEIPAARYQGWWIGLSPVTERQQENRSRIQLTGAQKIVNEVGEEGGIGNNVNIQASINGVNFDARQLKNAYQQAYITVYNQDVTVFSNSKLTETTNYYPHFSYTGNITNSDSAFRYYVGAIVLAEPGLKIAGAKTYIGLDYSQITDRGLTYGLGGIIYTNPDPEYHSYAIGSISQKYAFSPKNNLTLSGKVDYVPDGAAKVDRTLLQAANSSVSLGASVNFDRVSIGVSRAFASQLPNSIQNSFSTSLSLRLTDNLGISGYWTPWNENAIRSPFGASANLRLGNSSDSPVLNLGWSLNTTDFGRDLSNRSLQQQDNVFTASFQLK